MTRYIRLVPPRRPLPAIDTPWQTLASMTLGAGLAMLPWALAVVAHYLRTH